MDYVLSAYKSEVAVALKFTDFNRMRDDAPNQYVRKFILDALKAIVAVNEEMVVLLYWPCVSWETGIDGIGYIMDYLNTLHDWEFIRIGDEDGDTQVIFHHEGKNTSWGVMEYTRMISFKEE